MQRGGADGEPAADSARGLRSDRFAPTSLDLLLARAQRVAPKLSRTSDLLLIAGAGALVLVDVAVWRNDREVDTGRLPMSIGSLVPLLGALATAAVAVRPKRPALALATLCAGCIVLTIACWAIGTSLPPSFPALFALALLTTGVLRREPGGPAVLLAATAGLAVAAEALRPMVATAAYLLVLCEAALGIAVGVGVYLRWSDWRRVAAEDAARTDERLEIARELHDLVGHCVTGTVVQAQAARHVSKHRAAAAASALENMDVAGTDALAAMRRMVGGLRSDSPAAPGGTWDEVDELIAVAVAQGEPERARIEPDLRGAAPALVPSVHRIIAESLTNVRRHAREVSCIEVDAFRRAGQLVVTVHDDGAAAASPGHDTFGIVGIRERTASLGGSLFAGPAPVGGWLVRRSCRSRTTVDHQGARRRRPGDGGRGVPHDPG